MIIGLREGGVNKRERFAKRKQGLISLVYISSFIYTSSMPVEIKNKKTIIIALFLAIVFLTIGLVISNQRQTHKELLQLETSDVISVWFYKDFIRDSEGMELPLDEAAEIERFLGCVNHLEPSSVAVKSVRILNHVKIRVLLRMEKKDGEKETKMLEFSVMRTEELGQKRALVTLSEIRGSIVSGYTVFESDCFLPWLSVLSSEDKYAGIWE